MRWGFEDESDDSEKENEEEKEKKESDMLDIKQLRLMTLSWSELQGVSWDLMTESLTQLNQSETHTFNTLSEIINY